MRLAIFTHVEHFERQERYFAYGPYVREMNLWVNLEMERGISQKCGYAENLSIRRDRSIPVHLEVVAPLRNGEPDNGALNYKSSNLLFNEIPGIAFTSLKEIWKSVLKLPGIIWVILKVMRRADHLHLRCPGNIGLLACILQLFFPGKKKTAKYAGNWDPEAEQPWSYKLQRWILQNTFLTKNMTVLVYGEWPGQSKNVRPFFTASFSEKAILKVQKKKFSEPYLFVFVGNLVPGKGLKMALKVIQGLQERGVDCRVEIYGDGPERNPMEAYVEEAGIKGIEFKGNRSLEELELAYQKAHFVILPSKSEGWPKAVAEGMFFGCIPVVTDVSCVRWMLGDGERGVIIFNTESRGGSTEDTEENVKRILEVLGDRERMQRMSKAAREWSQEYTLERFEEGIREMLS